MHIPDNYLSPSTCAVMTAAMVPVWVISAGRVKAQLPKAKIPMMGVGGALSFLGMMFNIPLPGGTTGHAVGGTLIAVVLGPYAACISISSALFLQALIFGDGGILSFGANCFNMAFVLPFTGYAVYSVLKRQLKGGRGRLIAAGIGSYIGINAAAFCAAIEFGIQPMLFRDSAGNAMYCPYGLSIAVPAVMIGHLTVFGAAEVIYTTAVLAFVRRTSASEAAEPEMHGKGSKGSRAVKYLLLALIALTPLGLLAEGTAWGEWGADEIASTGAGFVPAGIRKGFSFEAFLPDYSAAGFPGWFGYLLSAVLGVSALVILFRLIGELCKKKVQTV